MQSDSSLNHLYKFLKEKKVFVVYLPLTFYWIILFIATTIPTDPLPKLFSAQDKVEHFGAYGILASLLYMTLHLQEKSRLLNQYAFGFSLFFLALYGAVDELHQIFVPGRYCDILDWTADVSGGLIGLAIIGVFLKKVSTNRLGIIE